MAAQIPTYATDIHL